MANAPRRPNRAFRRTYGAWWAAAVVLLPACMLESAGELRGDAVPDRTDATDDGGGPDDAGEDVGDAVPDGGCAIDEECNDEIACTRDLCAAGTHRCSHAANPAWCPDGIRCDPAVGCVAPATCSDDDSCDDGVLCTLDRCIDGLACLHEPPDVDGDFSGDIECGGGDCDDSNPDVHPTHAEICDDGIDNNCNGAADYRDPECPPPYGNDTCETARALLPDSGWIVGDSSGFAGGRASEWCGGEGPEAYYFFHLDAAAAVTLDTIGSDFDTVLYVLRACEGVEAACNDDRKDDPAEGSRLVFRSLVAGDYWVVVDGRGPDDRGTHRLDIAFGPANAGTATCDSEIDMSEGGTIVGWMSARALFDEDDWGSCGGMNGNQQRFRADVAGDAFLHVSTRSTGWSTVLYARDDGCRELIPNEIGCATGPIGDGAALDFGGRSGTIHLTLDSGSMSREGTYVLEINP